MANFLLSLSLIILTCIFTNTVSASSLSSYSKTTKSTKPNIVIIIADDMGYSDLGSYGGEINTPNIDSLASSGVRFSQFYNTSRCSTTRASLLTGRYSHNVQMGHLAGKRFQAIDGYRGDLDQTVSSLPEVLSKNGYKNYMTGKWHLSHHEPVDLQHKDISTLGNTPTKRGFDRFYGTLLGGNNYFDPKYLFEDDKAVTANNKDYYYTDAISQKAADYIDEHYHSRNAELPFFLYVAYTAPHWPIQAPEQTIAKYRERYKAGWDVIRQQRYLNLLEQSLINEKWLLSKRDEDVPAWASTKNKQWQAERMAVHAAMVDRMDQGVGKILNSLNQNDVADNTLIIFMSDNGASAEDFNPEVMENPNLKALIDKHLDKYKPLSETDSVSIGNTTTVFPGGRSSIQSIGPEWANVSNTPYREYKSRLYEGGIASPLLMKWPSNANIPVDDIYHQPAHVVDLMATVLDAANIDIKDKLQLDGISFIPGLHGEKLDRGAIFFEHEGHRAVINGEWKLISPYEQEWQLYNMKLDRTENQNLADKLPEHVDRLSKQYDAYAKANKVKPWHELIINKNSQ